MSIDDLLNQPLPSVADDGFSERVISRVRAQTRRRTFITIACIVACVALAFLLLPMRLIGAQLNFAVIQTASSAAISLAGAVIALTLLVEKQFLRF